MEQYSSPPPEEILAFSVKYSRRLYGSRRWQEFDREDFAQELAIKLLKAAERYDPSKKVPWGAYAHIIARGAYLDWYRRINEHEELLWDTSNGDEDYLGSAWDKLLATEDFIDLTPSEIVEWSKNFSEQQRKVIICLAMDYSQAEISRIMNLSESRINHIINDIQRKIRLAIGR